MTLLDNGDDVRGVRREDDAERGDLVEARVRGVDRAGKVVETRFAAETSAQGVGKSHATAFTAGRCSAHGVHRFTAS
jgi:hypothetical protein